MVGRQEKQQMSQFVVDRLEESKRYDIQEMDESHILIAQKPDLVENPSMAYIFLHNRKMPLYEYEEKVKNNRRNVRFVSNIFYKDGKMFLVRLGFRGKLKDDKSLKHYSKEERNRMVHLRGLEKSVLESQLGNDVLVYYQPKTDRLDEGLRGYIMDDVELDYSHIGKEHRSYGFVENRTADIFKIANERFYLREGGLRLKRANENRILIFFPDEVPIASPE